MGYFVMFYAFLILFRLAEVYRLQQSIPYASWRDPITLDEFLGPLRHRNEYWFMPLWIVLFVVVVPIVVCGFAGLIALTLTSFVVKGIMRTLGDYILRRVAYWHFLY